MIRFISAVVFASYLVTPAWADFKAGLNAYKLGDFETTLKEWTPLAEGGDANAQFNLGTLYEKGQGVPIDMAIAMKWYRRAADQDDARAIGNIGFLYERGLGVTKDPAMAFTHYEKAAELGNGVSQNNLAVYYRDGRGTQKNIRKALYWFRVAARNGSLLGQYNLALALNKGLGTPKDPAQAVIWFRRAAIRGHIFSQFILGTHYEFGKGVKKDLANALAWYDKAVENGSRFAPASVKRVLAIAIKNWQRDAPNGNPSAQYNLGTLHWRGLGMAKNPSKATEWWRKAALQGHAKASTRLGTSYATGIGVEKNMVKARSWFEKGAARSDAAAQFYLGWIYQNGHGVARDVKQAFVWYRKADVNGYQPARKLMNRLLSRSPKGRQLARKIREDKGRKLAIKERLNSKWGPKFTSPGLALKLVERKRYRKTIGAKNAAAVEYNLAASGIPPGRSFEVWIRTVGKLPFKLKLNFRSDKNGQLIEKKSGRAIGTIGFAAFSYQNGASYEAAIISADGLSTPE